ncbi:MAG: TIGR02270 family protein [Desulfobacula sp.]|uniref:TIGR02270 family protein n=1 Tax=Desulfobacula sp. TaxID=2593537 RepID=UPI0025C6AD74|nr:TIGR02270 family protein [Desulfobacula sp.]MCD4721613.1 TIGR02270 family protein [Desulfobacula sp.]
MPIIPEIMSQHAEEAAFLWLQRNYAVHEPHYSLSDLTLLDDRVEAHIDGLRIAGNEGWEIVKDELAWEEAGEVFTASILAFESDIEDRIQSILETGSSEYELSCGLISALGWLSFDKINNNVQNLLSVDSPDFRRIGLAACAVHRHDPGQLLITALSDDDPMLRTRALQAVGELGRKDLLPMLTDHFNEKDETCKFSAAWSAGLFKSKSAVSVLRNIAEDGGRYSEKACAMAVRNMNLPDAHAWLRELAQKPEFIRLTTTGYGVIGDPGMIPWLIQMMEVPEIARVAGESFTMITGVDIAYEDLEGEWSEGFEAGPTENPEDKDVDLDQDEDLPWPEPSLISEWWNKNKGLFKNNTRYLQGEQMSLKNFINILKTGFQRQRAAAAIELAMLQPDRVLFEVRAPGNLQKELLSSQGLV